MRRWRADIWPAVALGLRDVLMPVARLGGSLEVRVPDFLELSFPPALPNLPAAAGSAGIGPSLERAEAAGQDRRSSPGIGLSGESLSLLAALLIGLMAVVALVSLARLVVGEELFEFQHWRGHRG